MKLNWITKHLLLSGTVVLFFLIAMPLFNKAGEKAGAESLARMKTVWPDVMSLPEGDRALLAGLALTCHLAARPLNKDETIKCLKEAAADSNPTLPKGVEKAEAMPRLEKLISDAPKS